MRTHLTATIFAFAASLLTASAEKEEPSPPNIIFILADDLGWQACGFTGAKFFETPYLDKFASEGMNFTAAYSGGPNCAPTRACLMSGTYTPRHRIYTPGGAAKGNPKYMRLLVPARERKDKALERGVEGVAIGYGGGLVEIVNGYSYIREPLTLDFSKEPK